MSKSKKNLMINLGKNHKKEEIFEGKELNKSKELNAKLAKLTKNLEEEKKSKDKMKD